MQIYHWYARVHHWTPGQVDELTMEQLEWLPVCDEAVELAQEVIQQEAEAQNSSQRAISR